jgi:hypothetical protein
MEDVQITQSTNDNPAEQILLNPQSLPNRARTSNSKVALFSFKKKRWGVEHDKVLERPFASEVECCRSTLYIIVPHIIQLDSHTLALVNKKDVPDCIETPSVIGVDQLVEKKDLVHMCLGKRP